MFCYIYVAVWVWVCLCAACLPCPSLDLSIGTNPDESAAGDHPGKEEVLGWVVVVVWPAVCGWVGGWLGVHVCFGVELSYAERSAPLFPFLPPNHRDPLDPKTNRSFPSSIKPSHSPSKSRFTPPFCFTYLNHHLPLSPSRSHPPFFVCVRCPTPGAAWCRTPGPCSSSSTSTRARR